MGFNAKQPGKIKRADLVVLVSAVLVVSVLLLWALRG